jgi:uncharacterized protein (DUF1501 family)
MATGWIERLLAAHATGLRMPMAAAGKIAVSRYATPSEIRKFAGVLALANPPPG